mmetsp:Transcript_112596/g.318535  ORF Transcript_112596/g.318535 Transcript_112596/m.318535 type:complete len:200 (+) Transcript_112596:61-660(+)
MALKLLSLAGLATLAEGALKLGRAAEGAYDVKCDVSLGGNANQEASFTVRVHPDWAPKGAAQFKHLVTKGLYNDAGVFRIVPGFVAQFGLPATPQEVDQIPDDPVKHSNKRGTLVFATAGPNTRTSQLFINYDDNKDLDGMGFSPFGEVLEHGMEEVVDKFFSGYGEQADQGELTDKGDKYLQDNFPMMAKLRKCTVIQ